MFGLLAALNSLSKPREGRDALNYENYIRTGQGLPLNKIYRESSVDKQARKELAQIRSKQRVEQQIKFIRLMKKLLIKADSSTSNEEIDEELEQMRIKVAQLELKIEKSAREKDLNCEDMFNLDKLDDNYDIELEKMIRNVSLNIPNPSKSNKKEDQSSGDNVNIQTLNDDHHHPHNYGDQKEFICF